MSRKRIKKSFLILILFAGKDYHSEFQALEVKRHTLLSDKMSFYFFELPKLPALTSTNNMLLLWLSLFKAETEEELTKIKSLEVPVMNQAINAYYSITASSEFREMERLRDKARHDEAQALHNAERKAEKAKAFSIAKNLFTMDMPLDKIATATGLTRTEVEGLQNAGL